MRARSQRESRVGVTEAFEFLAWTCAINRLGRRSCPLLRERDKPVYAAGTPTQY